ncbi:MAG: chemotaxis protein CheW [Candidatus Omnitrophica bacterium]|nr:chemotaxis protein CheW [Candidatus Omnitrophota bacterium]
MDDADKIIIETDEDEPEKKTASEKIVRVLSFKLGDERYCVDITRAREVFKPDFITNLPNAPDFVTGVANFHGDIISLIDIGYFLGLVRKEGLSGTKVIVIDSATDPVGITVDNVDGAVDIEEASIQPPLATIKGRLAEFTKGEAQVDSGILVLLDIDKILNCEEFGKLNPHS